ncbi:hypothetical protein FBY04_11675 [Pseudomonas sp. SJZ080]|uniref:hypothetical protein n=1 Tax=Pseudomonas sp. SJZ080 TaxID=2572888 RepID=UPI00119A336B|nr:hypothetical protein [Pseudomonas sp. SJZ080]TWC51796.1 hypothetical protein FBY04_11675 [Pseudomonas sp. SJZ080]
MSELILSDLPPLPASADTPALMDDLSPPPMEFPDPNPEPAPQAIESPAASANLTAPPAPVTQQTKKPSPARSATLNALQGELPQTVCVRCPHAIWQQVPEGDVRVYCPITHSLIDSLLVECDGRFLVLL